MTTPSSQTIKTSAYFSLRIVNIDHYMAPSGPMDHSFCPFNAQDVPLHEVAVIRIFGATEGGQRACLHVHQVGERGTRDNPDPMAMESRTRETRKKKKACKSSLF